MAQQAWYKRYEEYRDEALRYIKALPNIEQNSPQIHEIRSFERFCDIKLIFESNTIEKAGTKTEGETREIIEKYFPHISSKDPIMTNPEIDIIGIATEKIKSILELELIPQKKLLNKIIIPSITFDNVSREFIEVLRHQVALKLSQVMMLLFVLTRKRQSNRDFFRTKEDIVQVQEADKELDLMLRHNKYKDRLFSQDDVLKLHQILASELLPNDAEVEAGNYRIHDIEIVGADVKFPSPELVPQAMKRFIDQSNTRVEQVLSGQWEEFIMVAAEVSYNFVRVHPFPDFNGRMSRLLLAMTLRAFGVPFNLALRGSVAKYRARYFYALKQANHGDLKPYATLIAMRLVESFREIDENLRLAGQRTLLELDNETL